MMALTQTDVSIQRKRYMDGEITHTEHYLWLADSLGITERLLPVSIETIRDSQDENLNDIPLQLWDARHGIVRGIARGLAWSLSDTVCTLKAVARRAAERA